MNKLILIQCQKYFHIIYLQCNIFFFFLFKGEEEEEEPPKVIVNEIKEDDAFYSKK